MMNEAITSASPWKSTGWLDWLVKLSQNACGSAPLRSPREELTRYFRHHPVTTV